MTTYEPKVSRRQFTRLGALGAAGLALPSSQASAQTNAVDIGLRTEFLMDLQLHIAAAQDLGTRRIVPVTGGTFEGPKLRGTALDGGGDWVTRRPDGASVLDVRATLQTDDDALIYIRYRGLVYTPEGGETYWRVTQVFETASEKYDWLMRIVSVGINRGRVPGKVVYSVYQIL